MDLQLTDKTAFVSGSTQGIGFAIAQRLLAEGATVIINGRTQPRIDAAVRELKQLVPSGKVSGVAADFSKAEDVKTLLSKLPDIDILVNNAGIFEPKPFEEITDEDWLRFYEINVLSGVRLSRHFFSKMKAKNWGRIIFISSESAINIPEEMIHYGMTKTAQLSISRGLAELTKGTSVTVNSVLPGPTKSEGVEEFVKQLAASQNISAEEAEKNFFKTARPTSLLQRFASVEEVANLVAYVASPVSSATNGTALRVDGGTAKLII
ncbi:SDR family NAD(P)-dependent oxidoreductase [Ohtaekwangia koreensis]|uniref:NAD(P)-dependent dehydrogenase, short-chain alcohol dehydrogenase family n=1 Tax=Ohtaekwangia koreensis TaxID=688867 RepID=A0A1T5L9N2_9BACT|nr:SDR family NAD(P)-dependent oxidoreductase [Ohtaekwangia koreensis]SKC72634.1 NAD(P)-dependent dehydrogenase, short-chain alcohol dehydrogenase family [Ohtaekwangia koreensis]